MKIYTRGGDKGKTSLFSGERVSKASPLVEAYGTVDELNSVLGVARARRAAEAADAKATRRALDSLVTGEATSTS